MAVTTTPQEILEAAYATSLRNQPTIIADEPSELLAVVNRRLKAIYTISIRFDPTYFGASASVPLATGAYAEPEDAGSIFYMEQDSDGAEVVVVLIDEKDADPMKLCLYALGRSLWPAGTNDPTGNITMYYTKEAATAATLGTTLDATWDEAHNDLLIQEVALFLAIKDGRAEEYDGLLAERNMALNRFIVKLESHYQIVRTKYPLRREINAQSFATPADLLGG